MTTPLRVRWADVDMQGIVFNPNDLVYADVKTTHVCATPEGRKPAPVPAVFRATETAFERLAPEIR